MENKIYVSDLVTTDIVEKLEPTKNYLISSEMGSGKNYWVRNVLLPWAFDKRKKTLILSHRLSTKGQQEEYLKPYKDKMERQFLGGMFDLMTYQAFQNMVKKKDEKLKEYEIVILDEAHYLVSDSSFNKSIIYAYEFLERTKATKIYMTATPDGLFYLPFKFEILTVPNYGNAHVKDLYRYETNELIATFIKEIIEDGNKAIVFHRSRETLQDFKIGKSEIIHAGNQHKSNDMRKILACQKFDSDVLNTTSLLAEGVEVKDSRVVALIMHGIDDIDKIVQATGRARNMGIKVDIFYKKISLRSVSARLNSLEKQLDYYDDFLSLGEIEFIKEHRENIHKMKFIDYGTVLSELGEEFAQLKIHPTALSYIQYQRDQLEFILENGFEALFDQYFPNVEYIDLEELKRQGHLKADLLEKYTDRKLFKEEQEELKNFLYNKYGLRTTNGKVLGKISINSIFEEENIPYKIESKKDGSRKSPTYGKWYWIINQIED